MPASLAIRVRCSAGAVGFAAVALGMLASVRADDARPGRTPASARTAVLARAATEQVQATAVDWSGYRGIRRYSPYYAPGYAFYRPYYGNYAYRPWYARPYAYAYGYPGYAPPYYRYRYPTYAYSPYAYSPYALYPPYAWGGFYPPPLAAPMAAPSVVVAPQVSSTAAGTPTDYVGCFYW